MRSAYRATLAQTTPARIGLLLGTAYPTDRGIVDHLDIEPACRRAVMRASRIPDLDLGVLVHVKIVNTKHRTPLSAFIRQFPGKGAYRPCIGSRVTPRH